MTTRHSVWRNKFWRLLKQHNFAYGSSFVRIALRFSENSFFLCSTFFINTYFSFALFLYSSSFRNAALFI